MVAMAAMAKDDEQKVGDGLYKNNAYLQIIEVRDGKSRRSEYDSIITRRKHFYGEASSVYLRRSTTFVLPNEFLT